MRIKKVELKNFKRFTDLTISDIPESSKLVLLIGSNGSGKSSVFDAFNWVTKNVSDDSKFQNSSYYKKIFASDTTTNIDFYDHPSIFKSKLSQSILTIPPVLIGRSSIRIVPRITNSANPALVSNDGDSVNSFIDTDLRFVNDLGMYIQKINNELREPVFKGQQADTLKIFKDYIEPLNNSLKNIFGIDENITIQIIEFEEAQLSEPSKLIFKKGDSKINYDLLSHGEKQVIILLLNFIVRQEFYKNCIVFIDEMDCHLNTSLQFNLLNEIVTRWIPDSSQLWTASHALGFIDYARESKSATTIDFDLLNFDQKQELTPVSKEKLEVYEIAIPKSTVSKILKAYKLVVVENKNDEHFNAALGHKGFLFLPANNNREVFLTVKQDKEKFGLRDRDYLRDDEIIQINEKLKNFKILNYSTFENYIFHPENVNELKIKSFNKNEYIKEIINQKNQKLIEIAAEIGTSRNHYIEFKDCIKNDEDLMPILNSLKSDDFETFYPFYNMKRHFNRSYLGKLNIKILDLSSTEWFKKAILKILNN